MAKAGKGGKRMSTAADKRADAKSGPKEGSRADLRLDKRGK